MKFAPEAQKEIDKYRKVMGKIDEIRKTLAEALASGDVRTAQQCLDELKKTISS